MLGKWNVVTGIPAVQSDSVQNGTNTKIASDILHVLSVLSHYSQVMQNDMWVVGGDVPLASFSGHSQILQWTQLLNIVT